MTTDADTLPPVTDDETETPDVPLTDEVPLDDDVPDGDVAEGEPPEEGQ